ncbi:MAG TPA: hypothetical protein VJ997_13880, partial [Longimicrobiales bacterium]|nr:hypothetical protein [Longimicrobiales bacterium]
PAALAGTAFARAQIDRRVDSAVLAGRVYSGGARNELIGDPASLPTFGADLKPGDVIRVNHPPGNIQDRLVLRVQSDTRLTVAGPLTPALPATAPTGATFTRKAEPEAQLFGFLSDPADTLQTGEAVMNHAADLAALLCLGGTTHLLDDAAKDAARVGTASGLNQAYQVFRNWNLDRRRVNEWKMLVQGGALSEKRGDPTAADPASPVDPGWTLFTPEGEAVSNRLGWVNVLRRWVDMASRPETDAAADTVFKPGDPTNLELSRAMAYLLDMRDPGSP